MTPLRRGDGASSDYISGAEILIQTRGLSALTEGLTINDPTTSLAGIEMSSIRERDALGHDVPGGDRPKLHISVVIPALNEARNLEHVFNRLPSAVDEVLLIDGHSLDDTIEVAKQLRPDIRVLVQSRRGKGNALACGFAATSGDIIVMVDADGSTDPAEIPSFVEALIAGADYAKGSRFLPGGGSDDITRLRRLGNKALIGLVNLLFHTRYTDLCYGYNAFWRDCLPLFDLPCLASGKPRWGDGFEIETLLNLRVARAGARVAEVASVERRRLNGETNLNAARDGWRVLRTIVRERRRLHLPAESPTPFHVPHGDHVRLSRLSRGA